MAWEIKGEAGKTLNATLRTLSELRIESCFLKFQALGRDTLTWTARTTNAAGGGTIVPDDKQQVEIYNSGGRRFIGHVISTRVKLKTVEVVVAGPWYWMERIDLTSVLPDGEGTDEERVKYVASAAGLDDKIIALMDRCIALGVPMIRGTVPTMWDTPKVTISGKTCAAGMVDLMQRCPDGVAYFEYSGAAGTAAIMRVARRNGASAMAAVDYEVGVNGLEDADIFPRRDLRVSRVEINYLDRHPTTGKIRYKRQGSGTAATGVAAESQTQKLTLSGDELVAFVPIEDFESVVVKSVNWNDISESYIEDRDTELAAIKATYGSVLGSRAASVTFWTGNVDDKQNRTVLCPTFKRKAVNGKALTGAQKWIHVGSTNPLPEWAITELGAIEVDIVGGWAAIWTSTAAWSDAYKAVQAGAVLYNNYWANSTTVGSGKDDRVDIAIRDFSVRCWLLSAEYATDTTVYKPWKFGFPAPPTGMAIGLREAQNWTPWEGTITLAGAVHVTGANNLNKVINLAGTLTECATMKATVRAQLHDIMRDRMTWTLGPPSRMDYGTSAGRVPASPQDLIELI
jgi:hypothetical protein